MPADDDVRRKLQAVARAYAESLPERIREMEALLQDISGDINKNDNISELHRLAHALAGSASTFGHGKLGSAAAELESRLREMMVNEGSFTERQTGILYGIIRRLVGEMEEITSAVPPPVRDFMPSTSHAKGDVEANARLVFLADDDELFCRNIATHLQYHDYRVRSFCTLESLRGALEKGKPDILVMDMIFPEGNGADLVREIRSVPQNEFPVVFVSVDGSQASRLNAIRAGGDAFLHKPLNAERLIDALDSLVMSSSSEPIRILIVDDSAEEAEYYAALLKEAGMVVESVTDSMTALSMIEHFHPEILLVDIYMPDCTGEELVRLLRQMEEYLDLPIIFLSGEQDVSRQVEALSSGADAFISKSTHAQHLVLLLTSMASRYKQLRSIMSNDGLTGLLVHSKIMDALGREVARSRRNQSELCFVMIDLDHFKVVNDTYGHPVGDRVIRALARLMKQRLRKTDYVGRYGGEEFAVIMPDTSIEMALVVIDQIRSDFSSLRFEAEDASFNVSFSAGVACISKHQGMQSLVDAADKQLYVAKEQGRNRVVADSEVGSE